MSDRDDEDRAALQEIIPDPDADTLRILVSTDNHLGYEENDNVRGESIVLSHFCSLRLARQSPCQLSLRMQTCLSECMKAGYTRVPLFGKLPLVTRDCIYDCIYGFLPPPTTPFLSLSHTRPTNVRHSIHTSHFITHTPHHTHTHTHTHRHGLLCGL
jgi:hypothetical protein